MSMNVIGIVVSLGLAAVLTRLLSRRHAPRWASDLGVDSAGWVAEVFAPRA
jgi:hypothetical protein